MARNVVERAEGRLLTGAWYYRRHDKAGLCGRHSVSAGGPFRAQPVGSARRRLRIGLSLPVAFVQDPTNAAVQFVVEQGGRIRAIQRRRGAADRLSRSAQRGQRRRRARAARPGVRARLRDERPLLRQLHQHARPHGRRALPAIARIRSSPTPASRFDLRWSAGGRAFIAQPFANHNGGHLAFGPDGYLYIGLGDGGSGNDPQHRAQNPAELLGKMLRIDVNVADGDPDGLPRPARQSVRRRRPPGARPEIWALRPAEPVALQLRRSRARRHRRAGHRRRRPERVGGDRLRAARAAAAATTAGAIAKGAHDNVTNAAAGVPAADRSDLRVRPEPAGSRSPAATSIAAARSARRYRGRYFFADFVRGTRLVARVCRSTATAKRPHPALDRAHRRARRHGSAGQHQHLRRRFRRRALRPELLGRPGAAHRQPLRSAAGPDWSQDHSMIDAAFSRELARAVGPGGFVSDPTDLLTYESDALVHLRSVREQSCFRPTPRKCRPSSGSVTAPACRSWRAATAPDCRAARCRIPTAC